MAGISELGTPATPVASSQQLQEGLVLAELRNLTVSNKVSPSWPLGQDATPEGLLASSDKPVVKDIDAANAFGRLSA